MLKALLKKLRPKDEPGNTPPPPRVGIPRSTFNKVAKEGMARLHGNHTAGIKPGSKIIIFVRLNDSRQNIPSICVITKRDIPSHLDGSLLLVKHEDG